MTDPWMDPYGDLPGTKVGPHDSLELRDPENKLGLTDGERLVWWHHADSPPAGARPKGGRCGGGTLANHNVTIQDTDPLKVTISPSLACRMCGRHIFISEDGVQDLGDAHARVKGTEE